MTTPRAPGPDLGAVLLVLGSIVGIAVAVSGIIRTTPRDSRALADSAIASVNGAEIPRAEYERAVRAAAARFRPGIEAADKVRLRRRILDRLVDEQLLIQRALDIGLAQRDPRVRTDLSAAMIDLLVARGQVDTKAPEESVLRKFYQDHHALFQPPELIRVERWRFHRRDEALAAARSLRQSADPPPVSTVHGPDPLPTGRLPRAKLLDYIGARALRTVLGLEVGGVSEPLKIDAGFQVLRLLERITPAAPAFDAIRDQVTGAYQRQRGDQRLRDFLKRARSQASIEVAESGL